MSRTVEQNRARLLAWVKQHADGWKPDDGPFHFEIAEDVGSYAGNSILSVEYHPYLSELEGGTGDNLKEKTAEALVKDLMQCAEDYAAHQETVTRFIVSDRFGKEHRFSVMPEASHTLDDDAMREDATEHGVQRQLMRHQEATMKMAISTTEVQLENMRRIVDSQRVEIDMLYKDRREQVKLYEELISQRHVRDMEIRQIENQEKRMERAGDMLAPMIPLLANKMLGAKLLPEQKTPALGMLEGLIGGLSKDQFQTISGVLEGPQKLVWIELFQMIYKMREEQEAKDHPSQASQNGESDAAE